LIHASKTSVFQVFNRGGGVSWSDSGRSVMASALPPLYAHRLGRHYGPDSSAAALRHTLTGPVEGLETDVCLTADERLVLLHDPLLTL
jgi:glycerophosphoryl diester phosphodiesterase